MSVALSAVIRTAGPSSPAAVVGELTRAVDRLPERVGPWRHLTVRRDPAGVDARPDVPRDLARRELTGAELRGLLPAFEADDVRIAASTGLTCWRFPGEPEQERLPVPLRVAAWGPGFHGRSDERGDGTAELVLDPVWPFRTPGGTVPARRAAELADNRALLIRLVGAVVETLAPVSVRLHTDVSPPLPFDAHLIYYRDAAAVAADLRWIEDLWLRGEPHRRIPALRDVPGDRLGRELHAWRPRPTLEAVRSGLGRAVAARERIRHAQIEDVLVAGSCPAHRMGPGFVVLGGEEFVDGFVDPFFAEQADLADRAG